MANNYRSYVALITQSGTSAPIAKVLTGTVAINWSYFGVGYYRSQSSLFTDPDKVWVAGMDDGQTSMTFIPISNGSSVIGYYSVLKATVNGSIDIAVYDSSFMQVDLGSLIGTDKLALPEIRIYN